MRATDITNTITKLIIQQLPVFVWGSPGIGKSSIVKQIANDMDMNFIDLRLSLLDPTDLKGIPFFDASSKQGVWAKPSFLPNSDDTSKGILFLDEINSAPPSVQASAYQLILDRKVGDYSLPNGWSIVAAGNRENDRGVVYRMPPPLANRFVHFEMEVNFEDWKKWAYKKGIDSSIISFLQYDKNMLFTFDATTNEKSFATPRSWEFVNTILLSQIESKLLLEAISGAVGKNSAVAYLSFKKIMNRLPNIMDILSGELLNIEDEDNRLMMALSIGIVNLLIENNQKSYIDNAIKFSMTLPDEFAIMLVKDMQLNHIDVESSDEWGIWVQKFAYLLT